MRLSDLSVEIYFLIISLVAAYLYISNMKSCFRHDKKYSREENFVAMILILLGLFHTVSNTLSKSHHEDIPVQTYLLDQE
ncbi:hypothetical protein A0U91_16770 (plasmid) [Acetobacter persici]|uniref:Uncharacterized protein n=1 Tax=Acetobacter persici TaxID=1076596 RepID=A0A1U9LJS4_9PROT|nr:hypothetical protein A0U91_16770 [Acetobacter persici]